jgi:hypothetical protein
MKSGWNSAPDMGCGIFVPLPILSIVQAIMLLSL